MSTDGKLLKNYIDSDSDHPVPDLMDQKTTMKIEHDVLNELFKGHENAKTTETDMLMGYIANEEKLKPESERKEFVKPTKPRYDSDSEKSKKKYDDSSDDLKDYYKKDKKNDSDSDRRSSHRQTHSTNETHRSETHTHTVHKSEEYSKEEEQLMKLDMMRKLHELTQQGVKLSQNYNMNSDLRAMKYEYELHKGIRDKHNGVKWLSNLMLNICYGVEIGNEHFNPFDFKLKGWSEQMAEDIDEYYEVMGELYDKYFKAGKSIPPELKLFFMISGSAIKFHFAQTMLKSMPNMKDQMDSNPELAQKLRQQAMNSRLQQQQEIARQKASDITMLKEKEAEFLKQQQQQEMQNQIYQQQLVQSQMAQMQRDAANKQKQIDELQRQLMNTRSDTRSNYTDGQSYSKPTPSQPSNVRIFTPATGSSSKVTGQKSMKPPTLPSSLASRMQETARQNSIMQQKIKMMQEDDNQSTDSQINFNPNLDSIIKGKLSRDNMSQITEGSTLEADDIGSEDSKIVVKKKRGRKPKSTIKIDTN